MTFSLHLALGGCSYQGCGWGGGGSLGRGLEGGLVVEGEERDLTQKYQSSILGGAQPASQLRQGPGAGSQAINDLRRERA